MQAGVPPSSVRRHDGASHMFEPPSAPYSARGAATTETAHQHRKFLAPPALEAVLVPFCSEKKDPRDLHHKSFKTDSYMTKYCCSNHQKGINHQPHGPVNPLQLSNRPQPRYIPLFQRQKQGARHRAWEGQISTNAVISHHDCRIEFCNLL